MMREAVIVQRRLPRYREALFTRMREQLATEGVRLRVLHGQGTPEEDAKRDAGQLDWAEYLPNTYLLGHRFTWQRFGPQVQQASLVIVGQENKLLYNLLAMTLERPPRLAYWGHGRNMQAHNESGASERFKRWLAPKVDWWFAYTRLTRDLVTDLGFPAERITVLDNAVDTSALASDLAAVPQAAIQDLRAKHALTPSRTALFLGSLYQDKRLDFLLASADALRARLPGFSLLVVGDGPMRGYLEAAAASRPWLHVMGARYGAEKALMLASADLILNPGLVGLGILDSFVAGVPMITTDCDLHSPEIAYLDSGRNGLMTANTQAAFVDAVAGLLQDSALRTAMANEASQDARHYSVEAMANRYSGGILACITRQAKG